ncbi:MAG: hypothetical protein E4H01_05400 [Lysobacterales bacterium]|nr:MAG: hypothetical protein E4H01_05400 [Xanthomonadales bacterium]
MHMPKIKRQYTIDLSLPADERWAKMIKAERANARVLIREAKSHMKRQARKAGCVSQLLAWLAEKTVPSVYRLNEGNFQDDSEVWADGTGLDADDVVLGNLSYELVLAGQYFDEGWGGFLDAIKRYNPFGCTALSFNLPKAGGVAHVRNLDWPIKACSTKSVLIHYKGAAGPFTTVGWPSFIGVMSGVAPGRFSATVNMAPASRLPSAQWPVAFALRIAFDECETFDQAVKRLTRFKLSAPALVMVVGVKTDQAVVIEHTGKSVRCRWMEDGVLAVANHFEHPQLLQHNPDIEEDETDDSEERTEMAAEKGCHGAQLPLARMPSLLGQYPIYWDETVQQMAFIPKTGRYVARYC